MPLFRKHASQTSRRRHTSRRSLEPAVLQSLEGRQMLSAVPAYSSRPNAYAKIYLNFSGDYVGSWGSYSPGSVPAYDQDGNTSWFNSSELNSIHEIWARVAEKFSPFNVDVTTVDPGNTNNGQTMRVDIGGGGTWLGTNAGGITYIGSFANGAANTNFVFSSNLNNGDPHYTAESIAHEVGHAFGLQHHSTWSGSTLTSEYDSGNSSIAPIMGNSYYATRGIWEAGRTDQGSSSWQDDMAVISSGTNGFGYAPDEAGNWINSAAPLSVSGTSGWASGVISTTSDSDYYSFTTGGGNVSFTANPAQYGPMLAYSLKLVNSSGNTLASSDNSNPTSETVSAWVPAGTYYIAIGSHGNYGDVGQYSISGSIGSSSTTYTPPPAPVTTSSGSLPAAPSNLNAYATSSSTINLSWNDNSNNETGFKIQRMANNSGNWQQVATVAAGSTSYTDSYLSASTAYTYRICSTNSAGDSAFGAWAYATTSNSSSTTVNNPAPVTVGTTPNGTKITGSAFGTAGSWNNSGNTFWNALDGNLNSYFDSTQADYANVGYDFGSAYNISAISFAPRSGLAGRMVGGQFQGSNDGSSWNTFYTVSSQPTDGAMTTVNLSAGSYRYVRYVSPAGGYGNVAEIQFYSSGAGSTNTTTSSGNNKISGGAFGTAGSWANSGSDFSKVFDGNLGTFFDAPTAQAYVGIDFGSPYYVGSARFAPRSGLAGRMVGGQFQGSNDMNNWTTLYTINSAPADGTYTTANFTNPGSYRYVRYLSPWGGYGNIAELSFYSGSFSQPASAQTTSSAAISQPALTTQVASSQIAQAAASDTLFQADPTPVFCNHPITA